MNENDMVIKDARTLGLPKMLLLGLHFKRTQGPAARRNRFEGLPVCCPPGRDPPKSVRRLQQTLYKIFCQLKSTVYLLQRASRTWSVLTIDEDVTCTPSLVNHPKKVGTAAVSTEEEE